MYHNRGGHACFGRNEAIEIVESDEHEQVSKMTTVVSKVLESAVG